MCCLKIDTETLLANCLNTCKTYSFSPDDLQQIVRLMQTPQTGISSATPAMMRYMRL